MYISGLKPINVTCDKVNDFPSISPYRPAKRVAEPLGSKQSNSEFDAFYFVKSRHEKTCL